jgi:outer membrane biosynthesis protein TonB
MTQAFAKYGVTPEHLEKRLGHKLDTVLLDELVEMTGIFNALKEGEPASEYFGDQEAEATTAASVDAVVKQAAANGAAAAAATPKAARTPKATPAPTPTPAPAPEPEPAAEPQPDVAKSQPVQKESTTVKEQAAPAPVAQAQQNNDSADEGDIF